MSRSLIRVWNELDIEEIRKHLFVAGELTANCENCQQLGIDFNTAALCPQCGTAFKYIAFRKKSRWSEEISAISRLKEKRPDLVIVDYEDIKQASGKSKARQLFGK